MNDYIEVRLDLSPMPGEDATDLLAAILGDIGFESFVPDDAGLTAYVQASLWDADRLADALNDFPFEVSISESHKFIEGKDWNEEWEKNYFKPIVIGDSCVVHSSFHHDVPKARYDIVIDPKMAFGTGHHATTSLMAEALLSQGLEGKSVIDMGTGTGILAILAAMLGASSVTAIEIDPFAKENALENVTLNGRPEINVLLGDVTALAGVGCADIFVANINRNVITADIAEYARHLKKGGLMLLSGFYVEDIPLVRREGEKVGLSFVSFDDRDNWACLRLRKE